MTKVSVSAKNRISTLTEYIDAMRDIIKNNSSGKSFFVFRGEGRANEFGCRPGIYRNDVLEMTDRVEIAIADLLRQSGASEQDEYLRNTIDAQHDGFKSRLLDVSYNCLSALYFATTPYYHFPENKYDNEDGVVYAIRVDEIYSPFSENINKAYKSILFKEPAWINSVLMSNNHKFIDGSVQNPRIVAQQGAFILFQGNGWTKMPEYMVIPLKIAGEAKSEIRKDLKNLFGIHTGSIYPEVFNLVDHYDEKSKLVNCEDCTLKGELDSVFEVIRKDLEYRLDRVTDYLSDDKRLNEELFLIEKLVKKYRNEIWDFFDNFREEKTRKEYLEKYEDLIIQYKAKLAKLDITEKMINLDDI